MCRTAWALDLPPRATSTHDPWCLSSTSKMLDWVAQGKGTYTGSSGSVNCDDDDDDDDDEVLVLFTFLDSSPPRRKGEVVILVSSGLAVVVVAIKQQLLTKNSVAFNSVKEDMVATVTRPPTRGCYVTGAGLISVY
mmetsp:Transcript_10388/g.22200  ORF Transcript_10388/g.22200 Transcript_10388/m.22200 type:complete len:136 (-) Transcript_10388:8-415(-)